MSDQPQGPGWWQASDGKYYPPESAPSATQGASEPTAAATTETQPQSKPIWKRWWFWVLVVLIAIVVIAVASSGGDDATSSDEATVEEEEAPAEEPAEDAGSATGGATATNDLQGFVILDQIVLQEDFVGDFEATFRARNDGSGDQLAFFTVNPLSGGSLVGSLDCIGGEASPGDTVTVDCISTDVYTEYDEITIEYSGF